MEQPIVPIAAETLWEELRHWTSRGWEDAAQLRPESPAPWGFIHQLPHRPRPAWKSPQEIRR